MSHVMYDGQRLIPAPFLTIQKQYQRSGDGLPIGSVYSITVNGTIIAYMGSPSMDESFYTSSGYPADDTPTPDERLQAIQSKQNAILELFSVDGRLFEAQALSGMERFKCRPRILSINFDEGLWYDQCKYTIQMEADEIMPSREDNFEANISSATETWSMETDETAEGVNLPNTYRLSHTVSAVGKNMFDDDDGSIIRAAWKEARDYVLSRLGFDSDIALASGVLNLPSYYTGYNHVRSQNVNESDGSFEVTETWIVASGIALEDFTIEKQYSNDSPFTRVSVQGSITGLEQRDSNMQIITTKYQNASTKLAQVQSEVFTRAQTYSGVNLNIVPMVETIGQNPINGTATYTYEYDDRPNIIAGARTSNVSVTDNRAGQMYASIFVLGRNDGPVLQDLSTYSEKKRSLSIECVMNPVAFSGTVAQITSALNNNPRLSGASATQIQNIITAASPQAAGYTTYFYTEPQEVWEPYNGRYTYSISWSYE